MTHSWTSLDRMMIEITMLGVALTLFQAWWNCRGLRERVIDLQMHAMSLQRQVDWIGRSSKSDALDIQSKLDDLKRGQSNTKPGPAQQPGWRSPSFDWERGAGI